MRNSRRVGRSWRTLAIASALAACTGDVAGPPQVALVEITPGAGTLQVFDTMQLQAVAKDRNGVVLTDRKIVWSSDNVAIAKVNANGTVTGILPGTANVTATSDAVQGTAAIVVTPGAPVALAITRLPGPIAAGAPLSPALLVSAQDSFGNTATSFTGDVSVSLDNNPAGATLSGSMVRPAQAGVATFADLTLDKIGSGFTLQATSGTLAAATSAPFGVVAGAVSDAHSDLVVSPDQVAAGGGPATIMVTLKDGYGNPVSGATVTLGASGTGNTIGQPAPTDVNGVTTGTLASTAAGVKQVSATVNGGTLSTTATVTVTPGAVSASQSTVAVSPATIGASNGGVTSTITVTAKDEYGNPISGSTVVLAATGSGNSVTQPSGTTNDSGAATGTLSSTNVGTKTVTATIDGVPVAQTANVAVTAGAVSASQSSVAVSPGTIAASGGGVTSTITVTLKDGFGNPIPGATVTLAATGSGNTITQPGATDASGMATGTLSSTAAGSKTVTATANSVALNQQPAITVTAGAVSASQSAVAAAPATIGASNGGETSTITVTAKDGFGNPINGATVVLAATGTGNTLTQPSGTTNGSGVATGTLSSTDVGTKTVSATIDGVAVPQTPAVAVTVGSVSASQSAVAVSPGTITASNGSVVSTITVTVRDGVGNPIPGATVTLAATGSGNTITQPGATNASGVTTGTLSSTATGSKTVTATANSVVLNQQPAITVNAGAVSASQSTVSVSPTSITASTGSVKSTITVTAKDGFGNPINGATVVLGATGTGNTLTQPGATTNGSGVATGTLSSTDPGTKTVSAAIDGVAVTPTAAVTVTVGSVSASQSMVAVSPGTITASNGSVVSTITVTVKDGVGNPIPGATVTLAATGSGNTITQPGATDASGVTTGTLSSTAAGSKTVTATANSTALNQQPAITVTAGAISASQSTVAVSPATIGASNGGVASTITVTAKDGFGNPISGATVVLAASGTGNTLTQPSGTTNGSGVATGTLSSTDPGTKTVSATIDGVAVTQTQTVTVTVGSVSSSQSTVAVSPGTITASNGSVVSTITVTVKDGVGNPIPGATVTLAATGSGNTITQPGATDASGVTTGTLSSTAAGSKTVTATVNSVALNQQPAITVNAGAVSASQSSVSASPTSIGASTGSVKSTITVTAKDGFGNPISGSTVVLGATGTGNTLTQPSGTTNGSGVATGTLSSTDVGTKTVSATIDGVAVTQTATVTVTVGSVSASQSTVVASPGTIVASSGSVVSTITVTVKDGLGNPIPGATVTLSATGSGNTITQPGTTNGSGVTTGTLSSTGAGSKTVTAVAGGVTLNQKPSVSVTAGPISASQSTVGASPLSIMVGSGSSTITVTVKDAFGNPISGSTVVLAATGSGNSLTQPSGVTNGSGVATGTLSSSVAESKIVSAQADGNSLSQTVTVQVTSSSGSWVMVGAGDIADCGTSRDDSTGALISRIPGQVFTLGDDAYPDGTTSDFANCYDPAWGSFKSRTRPIPGNHEYNTSGAGPYYAYFGALAGPAGLGYYSYDVGTWHIITLNGEISTSVGSPQETWLRADLAAHPNLCTMAMVHEPLWSSEDAGSSPGVYEAQIRPLWDDMYAAGVDLVLSGHRHNYERISPIKPDGTLDLANGIRQIIVGTGGVGGAGTLTSIFPYSEVREPRTFGVIKFTLTDGAYSWQFIPITGETFTDSGSATCH